MAADAIFALTLLAHDAGDLAAHRRLPLRHRLLRYSASCIVLGASSLFHAVAIAAADPVPEASNAGTLALAGFLLWAGGLALLLLAFTAERFRVAARRAAQIVDAVVATLF